MKCGSMVAVLSLAMLVMGCSDDTRPPSADDAITGRVVDADGMPVAGASIMLEHDDGLPFGAADKPNSAIRFLLPGGGHVSVWVSSYCDDDTVRMLVDDMDLPEGEFQINWNGLDDQSRMTPDGVYWFHVVLPDTASQTAVAQMHRGYAGLAADAAVAAQGKSDLHGAFALSQACLPFGHAFTFTDESGEPLESYSITRLVRVWALHPAYAPAPSDWVTVDAVTGAHMRITLRP